ncbi:DUF3800 domain-containing protein [Metallibacterium sp.]
MIDSPRLGRRPERRPLYSPSHQSIGIQFADMVAGAVYRKYAKGDDRFFDQIVASFRASPRGEINGFGIVHFPKP